MDGFADFADGVDRSASGDGDVAGSIEVPVRRGLPTARDVFGVDDDRQVLTQTAIATLQACPRKFELRYLYGLDEPAVDGARWFGRQFHDAKEHMLKAIAGGMDPRDAAESAVRMIEERLGTLAASNWYVLEDLVRLRVAIRRYAWRWFRDGPAFPVDQGLTDGEWNILSVEARTLAPITNPATGAESRTFVLGLRTDETRELKADGSLWLGETKTAARIDQHYIDRLWVNFQLSIYGAAVSATQGRQVVGAVYDVIVKCGLRRGKAFEEDEGKWRARLAEDRAERTERLRSKYLAASQAKEAKLRDAGPKRPKKGEPETDAAFEERIRQECPGAAEIEERVHREVEEAHASLVTLQRVRRDDEDVALFEARVDEYYAREESFRRMLVPFDRSSFARVADDRWDATQTILFQAKRPQFTRHTGNCYAFNRACAFAQSVCKHGGGDLSPQSMTMLVVRTPHEELRDAAADPLPESEDGAASDGSMI